MSWFAIYTRPRWEKKILSALNSLDIEAFLPLRMQLKQWSDRKKWVEEPLFPGYIFVNVTGRAYFDAINVTGAVRYVAFQGEAVVVPDAQIEAIRIFLLQLEAETKTEEPCPEPGVEVEIIAGPLAGISGIMQGRKGHHKVTIYIESVKQSIMVEIPRNNIRISSSMQH